MRLFIFISLFFIGYSYSFANIYIENIIDWHKVRVIKYDINDNKYNLKIWVNKDWNSTSLRELIDKNNWITGVNWVFFCPKSYISCWWIDSTKNERYFEWVNYSKTSTTGDRAVFWIDTDWQPLFYKTNKINPHREDDIYYWFWNFPLILYEWKNLIPSYDYYWLLDEKMKIKLWRNFVCTNKQNSSIYFWFVDNISLYDISWVLHDIWCYNALNLDAGGSSSMIYNSRDIIGPGRKIMDWLVIERKWLDTSKLIKTSKLVIKNIDKKLKNKSYEDKIIFLNNFSNELKKIRTNLYEKNSRNIYNSNWEINWYKIYMNSINNLSTIYILNRLDILIKELKDQYFNQNLIENNNKNLLF